MKAADMIAAAFLFIGGINWDIVDLFSFDLIGWIFGSMSVLSRWIYVLVGVSAIYGAVMWNRIIKQRECRGEFFSKAEKGNGLNIKFDHPHRPVQNLRKGRIFFNAPRYLFYIFLLKMALVEIY
jgi:uncharacterized membrane protein YuzA (DUF378 family)